MCVCWLPLRGRGLRAPLSTVEARSHQLLVKFETRGYRADLAASERRGLGGQGPSMHHCVHGHREGPPLYLKKSTFLFFVVCQVWILVTLYICQFTPL